MSTFASRFATGYFLAVAIAAVGPTGGAFAQNSDAIREKCIALAGNNTLTGNLEDARGRARFQVYANCMQQHGLKP
jgi:hypothetical protein